MQPCQRAIEGGEAGAAGKGAIGPGAQRSVALNGRPVRYAYNLLDLIDEVLRPS